MIDHVKFEIPGVEPRDWLKGSKQDFTVPMSLRSELPKTGPIRSSFKNFQLKMVPGKYGYRTFLWGSLHKSYFDGKNYTDFSIKDVGVAILELESHLGMNLSTTVVKSFEFGVNLSTQPYTTAEILRAILELKGRNFKEDKGLKMEFQTHDVKIYSKSDQCKLSEPMIRFEIRIKKLRFLAGIRISSLYDLGDEAKMQLVGLRLLKILDQIQVLDSRIFHADLPPEKITFLDRAQYPRYWSDLKSLCPSTTFYSRRRELRRLQETCLGGSLKDYLTDLAHNKVMAFCKVNSVSLKFPYSRKYPYKYRGTLNHDGC